MNGRVLKAVRVVLYRLVWLGWCFTVIDFYQMLLLVKFFLGCGNNPANSKNDGAPGDVQPRRSFVWLDPFLHKGGFV